MVYICGMCGTEYQTVSEGLECEKSHTAVTMEDLLEPFDGDYDRMIGHLYAVGELVDTDVDDVVRKLDGIESGV